MSRTHFRTAAEGCSPANVIELSRQFNRKKNLTPSRYFAGAGGLHDAARNSSGDGQSAGLLGSTRVSGRMKVEIIEPSISCRCLLIELPRREARVIVQRPLRRRAVRSSASSACQPSTPGQDKREREEGDEEEGPRRPLGPRPALHAFVFRGLRYHGRTDPCQGWCNIRDIYGSSVRERFLVRKDHVRTRTRYRVPEQPELRYRVPEQPELRYRVPEQPERRYRVEQPER